MPPRKDLSDRFASGGSAGKRRRPISRPNVPLATGPTAPPADGAADAAPVARPTATAPSSRPASAWANRRAPAAHITRGPRLSPLTTDFESVRHDLRRISVLAAGILAILVVLSFVIH